MYIPTMIFLMLPTEIMGWGLVWHQIYDEESDKGRGHQLLWGTELISK